MSELERKNKFHATKVDRIAIVDRPAVPDAQILIYKREGMKEVVLDKQYEFGGEYATASIGTATDILQRGFWSIVYSPDEKSGAKANSIKMLFEDYLSIVNELIGKIPVIENKQEATPTTADFQTQFTRGLSIVALGEAFNYLKAAVCQTAIYAGKGKAKPLIKMFVETFQNFCQQNLDSIVEKMQKTIVVDKEGRIISSARLKKLQEAVGVIQALIEEATPKATLMKSREEETKMDEKQLQEIILKALAPLTEEISKLKGVLLEKGILEKELTEEEKTAKIEAEKKAQEEAEKKAKEEADAKAEAEKKAKEDVEKREKELTELKAKAESQEKELVDMKKKFSSIDKSLESFEKRTGIKVSLDADEMTAETKSDDVFSKSLKGKKQ